MLNREDLLNTLNRLNGEPADALESEVLEFKSWQNSDSYKRKMQIVRETVVGFANARGGALVLGVGDRKHTKRDAIHGVGDLDSDNLRRDIYDGTDPPILVDIQELMVPEGRVLVIGVPRGVPPHTTSDGLGKIRVGKDTKPLSGSLLAQMVYSSRGRDQTADVLPGVGIDALDPEQITLLRRDIRAEGSSPELASQRDVELLSSLNLVDGSEVTLAALLLLGKGSEIIRHLPQHELIFMRYQFRSDYDIRHDFRTPILETLDRLRNLFEANHQLTIVETDGFRHFELPNYSWIVVREAILNALMHRDYFLNQSIHVNLHDNRVEVTSPGGFIGGVTERNVLRHEPVRRNPLLASALQAVGLVNRVGLGVDRIYDELLRLGKDLPRYEVSESYVKLIIPTVSHAGFARFVAESGRRDETLDRDDLIVLRSLITLFELDRWSAAEVLHLSDRDAASVLISLRERGFLNVSGRGRGATYRLSGKFDDWQEATLRDAGTQFGNGKASGTDDARAIVLMTIADQGSITNAEIRERTGYSRREVLRLTTQMRNQGLIEVRGTKRGARYVRSKPDMNRDS